MKLSTLDKSGDLIHKMYLQIDIPEVELTARNKWRKWRICSI